MTFEWDRFLAQLPNLLCAVLMLNGITFSFRGLTFGPLLLEAKKRKVARHYPLSDLVALMLLLQFAAGGALAIAQHPGVQLSTLAWNPPLDVYGTANAIVFLLLMALWWWLDSTWMLNAAGVKSGWTRFTFLTFWTPAGYLSHWLVFFGGCGVLATIASRQPGIRFTENTARISPIAFIGLFAFACLAIGLFGMILARWWSNRLADTAFQAHMSSFRQRLREQERLRAEQAREALARAAESTDVESTDDEANSGGESTPEAQSPSEPEAPEKSI